MYNNLDNTSIVFNFKNYISDMTTSYGNTWCKIWKQFLVDFPRTIVDINTTRATNSCDFFINIGKNKTAILLCTQSAFYMPFDILTRLYSNGDVHVVDCKDRGSHIEFKDSDVRLTQYFQIKNCQYNTVLTYIDVVLSVNLNDTFGVFTWSFSIPEL